MDVLVEEQVRHLSEAVRAARAQPGGLDLAAVTKLTGHVQASAGVLTTGERRTFLDAVGRRLQAEAGPSQERKLKGSAKKHRLFDDPDGQSIHDLGTLVIGLAKRR